MLLLLLLLLCARVGVVRADTGLVIVFVSVTGGVVRLTCVAVIVTMTVAVPVCSRLRRVTVVSGPVTVVTLLTVGRRAAQSDRGQQQLRRERPPVPARTAVAVTLSGSRSGGVKGLATEPVRAVVVVVGGIDVATVRETLFVVIIVVVVVVVVCVVVCIANLRLLCNYTRSSLRLCLCLSSINSGNRPSSYSCVSVNSCRRGNTSSSGSSDSLTRSARGRCLGSCHSRCRCLCRCSIDRRRPSGRRHCRCHLQQPR